MTFGEWSQPGREIAMAAGLSLENNLEQRDVVEVSVAWRISSMLRCQHRLLISTVGPPKLLRERSSLLGNIESSTKVPDYIKPPWNRQSLQRDDLSSSWRIHRGLGRSRSSWQLLFERTMAGGWFVYAPLTGWFLCDVGWFACHHQPSIWSIHYTRTHYHEA